MHRHAPDTAVRMRTFAPLAGPPRQAPARSAFPRHTLTAPPRRHVLRVRAGHLQAVRAAAVTGASVPVSFDAGKTWHRARVTGHGGSYAVVFTAPPGALVTLRTSAAGAAGGTVTETITSAHRTG